MSDLEQFIDSFSGYSEEYSFYNGEVRQVYNKEKHEYLLVKDPLVDESKLPLVLASVTQILHKTIDRSQALIPWGCKMMGEKMLRLISARGLPQDYGSFEDLIAESKGAHREKLEEAGDLGHQAHNWIEEHIHRSLPGIISNCQLHVFPQDERAANACIAALDWMKAHNVRWLSTETKVYSRIHQVPGTGDGRAIVDSCSNKLCCPTEFKDKLSWVDWKTSNYLYLDYLFQIAFYAKAWMEEHPEDIIEDLWVIRLGKEDAEFQPWHIDTAEELEVYCYGFLNCLKTYHSIKHAEDAIKNKLDRLKAAKKEQRAAEKAEALKLKCANSNKYKAIRKPTCNKGNPCVTCINKYLEAHPQGSNE